MNLDVVFGDLLVTFLLLVVLLGFGGFLSGQRLRLFFGLLSCGLGCGLLTWHRLSFVDLSHLFPLEECISGYSLANIIVDLRSMLKSRLDALNHTRGLVNFSALLLALEVILPFLLDFSLFLLVDVFGQMVHHFYHGLSLTL